jgi:hypothetical protein
VIRTAWPFDKSLKSRFDYYAYNYCYPYFHQDWRLFTPCPRYSIEITVLYKLGSEDKTTLPLWEILNERTVLNGRELLMLATVNAVEYVSYQKININNALYQLPESKETQVLRQTLKAYLKDKHGENINRFKTCIRLTDIKSKECHYILDQQN